MTIPIYMGARKIGDFFNTDGIIRVEEATMESILNAIRQCTEKYYEEHIPAILDNFNRVYEFVCVEDYLMEHYRSNLD